MPQTIIVRVHLRYLLKARFVLRYGLFQDLFVFREELQGWLELRLKCVLDVLDLLSMIRDILFDVLKLNDIFHFPR